MVKYARNEAEVATVDLPLPPGIALAREEEAGAQGNYLRPRPRQVSTSTTITDSLGDPRYLEIIRKCVETRSRILGLDAGVKMTMDIRAQAENAANALGRSVEDVIKRAEEIAARAWGKEGY